MAQLNEIYPSYYNVLAYPPLILDDKSLYDQYTEWKKKIDKTWKQYDKDFLPKPLMDLGKSLAEAYKGDPDGYLHIANTAIRIAFLLIPGGQTAAFGVNLVLNKAIGIFYPPQNKSLFDQIKDAVSNLVDQKLIDQEISGVLIKLNSLQQPLSRFSNSIQRAVGKPQDFDDQTTSSNAIILDETQDCSKDDSCSCSNTQPRPSDAPLCTPCICRMKEVQQTFNNSSTDVNRALTDMKTTLKDVVGADQLRSYMQIYLPLYVTAATMELQMYKTYIDFTQKFDFDVTGTTKEHVNELRQKIKTHSEYIMGLFKKSLPEISNNTKEQLNAYIKYTRNITLNALDMVSTWKFLDPVDYPTTATFNPTRIIFNDLAGPVECLNSTQDSNKLHFNFFDMNGQSMPNNDIFNYFYRGMQVKGLQIQTYTSSDTKNPQHFPVGFLSSYYGSNGDFPFDKRVDPNKFTGGSKSVKLGDDVYESRSALSVINAVSNQLQVFLNYIDTEDLYFDQSVSPGGTACGSGNSTIWPDQKIQAIYPIQPDNSQTYPSYYSTSKIGFVTTLVPNDTTPWITFTDNGNNSIYTFSAENTRTLTGSAGPVREFITGSAPLGLSPGGGAQYSINTSDAPSGDYQVRVHVATPGSGGSLAISVDGKTQTLQLPDTNVNDTNHIAGFAGTYTLAPATQVDAATLKPKAPTENIFPVRQTSSLPVSITNNSSTVINIDRIEFVPV
ncbi:insecticidal delta-endotoxin Cry8Ea1 family protein, partial [Bacillus wiedmannii]|uniref:insecticidal delta-endotoxin Cry8Ea1 family protein n=1 Tax=Bacillus wiedmannii TaxID=1890302 RepID=UPI000211E276|nr:insecticidal delta-endotoxin Cry8Ea1 family protein [Bacillus wiedmannii]